ncbi:MAG TPA: hypothetical protein VFR65_02155 [Nitrososphaeraceae archaeon]|jgi:hypothetical protein|nr:hypothetical protein [Nitrososphaeraceae archaeon]
MFIYIVIVLFTSSIIINTNEMSLTAGFTQKQEIDSDKSVYAQDTFSAIGQISSLVITVPESNFNITNVFKVILTGEWIISVNKGNVTNFSTNFLASPMDGSKSHIHQITNFKLDNDSKKAIAQLTPDNSLSVNGTVDIKINGQTIWNSVGISISISNGSTIAIDVDDEDTNNHFGQQQLYGIVTKLIDFSN